MPEAFLLFFLLLNFFHRWLKTLVDVLIDCLVISNRNRLSFELFNVSLFYDLSGFLLHLHQFLLFLDDFGRLEGVSLLGNIVHSLP